MNDDFTEYNNEATILSKINDLENKIRNFLNLKLKLTLTGNEIQLDLQDKNIGNTELILLTGLDFKNLEELNLSNNNISELKYIEKFNSKKLKKIDLSFNKINDIDDNNYNICNINSIYNSAKNLPPEKNFKIILDHNSIKKDIKKIKNLIINDNNKLNPTKKIQKLSDNQYNPENNKFFTCSKCYKHSNNNRKNEIKEKLLNRIEKLENIILEYFNINLSMNLTGKEKKINLSNKNIGNIELNLLNGVDFKNLEEIDLSHNEITDVKPINSFKKVKKLDLSFNKINDIQALENNKQLEKINLSNNEIKDVEIFKKNIFPNIVEINLDNNNIIKKEIEEIKNIVKNNMNNKQNMGQINSNMFNQNKTEQNLQMNMNNQIIMDMNNMMNINNMNMINMMNMNMNNMMDMNNMKMNNMMDMNNKMMNNPYWIFTYYNMIQKMRDKNNMMNPNLNNIFNQFNNLIRNNLRIISNSNMNFTEIKKTKNLIPRSSGNNIIEIMDPKENPASQMNIILKASSGFKVLVIIPSNKTVEDLFLIFAKRIKIGYSYLKEKIIFIYNGENLKFEDSRRISDVFFNSAEITVIENDVISGA